MFGWVSGVSTDILDKRGISVACLRRLRVFGPSIPLFTTIVGYSHIYESGGSSNENTKYVSLFLANTNSVELIILCLSSNTYGTWVLVQMEKYPSVY